MAKSKTTEQLENDIFAVTSKIGIYSCFEVTIGIGGNERVDYMTLDGKGIWRCYEIKCSVADFHSKASKSFYGHYNYYVLTAEVYEKVKDEIPSHIGIYVGRWLKRKAKKIPLSLDENTLKLSFIRSLSREATKYRLSNNPKSIEQYNRRINMLEKDKNRYRKEFNDLRTLLFRAYGRNWNEIVESLPNRVQKGQFMSVCKLKF